MNHSTKKPPATKPSPGLATDNSDSDSAACTEQPRQLSAKGMPVFCTALLSLAMLWLSFPPVGWWWLAWIALIPMIWLIQLDHLPSGRPYRQLYVAGLVYWLATFYFIPIPHPALWLGWIAVSAYMACYTPLFVSLSRAMIHRFRLPAIIAVPIVGTGIEWLRCNFATGMAMACLSHTQYRQPMLIQIADLFGAYSLTFAILGVSTGAFLLLHRFLLTRKSGGDRTPGPLVTCVSVTGCVLLLSGVLIYGNYRLNEPIEVRNKSVLRVALIQTSEDVIFGKISDEEQVRQIDNRQQLTWDARRTWRDLDLIIWPESGFNPYTDMISDANQEVTVDAVANVRTQAWADAIGFPRLFPEPIPLLTGAGTADPANEKYYGSALLIQSDGQVGKRYFKNHLVMFGEYVPFADRIPIINQLSPIQNITAGTEFVNVEQNGVNLALSICFETTIPHFIRRQVNTLANTQTEPDVLVNLTNDGWFYGTSCLDLHLACNVFRAIEMRKPHLVCANTGFSASIDSCGRLLQTGPRRDSAVLRVEVQPIVRSSLYRQMGDLIPSLFAAISLLTGVIGWYKIK